MHRILAGILLLGVLPFSAASQQTLQQTVPRFKTGVELIVLDVSVLDADRRPVRGLTAADFTVLEDGRPQEIASFSAVDLPDVVEDASATAPWVRTVAPDVRRNTDLKDRRIVVIVMDDATPMPAPEIPRAKALAREMIEALGPDDLACVVYTFSKRSGQEFTQDRARLLAAVNRFNGAIDNTPGIGARGVDVPKMPFDQFNLANTTLYEGTLRTIRGLADDLVALPGRRKALVLVSVGIPLETPEVELLGGGDAGAADVKRQLLESLRTSLAAAQRGNVTVYGLDPGGLRAPYGVPSADPTHPGRLNGEFLKTVSEHTGGFAVVDTNTAGAQIQQILRENASYYLLGYAPSTTRAAGRFRRVEVRVNRPRVTVRARRGYYEPRADPAKKTASAPAGALGAMTGLLPVADLSMSLAVAPFAQPGQRDASLAVVVGVRRQAPKQATRVSERLDVRIAAYEPGGQQRAAMHQVMPVTVNASGAGGTIAYELLLRLDVPPGRYQFWVAAERTSQDASAADDDAPERNGSVYTDLDVPDFAKEPLSLSGLALSVAPPVVSGPKGALDALLPIVPTTAREFRPDDRVKAFFRVYQGGNRPVVPVTVAIRMLDGRGAVPFERSETMSAQRFAQVRSADLQFEVPIGRLSAGPYLLTVEARANKATTRREVRFVVR